MSNDWVLVIAACLEMAFPVWVVCSAPNASEHLEAREVLSSVIVLKGSFHMMHQLQFPYLQDYVLSIVGTRKPPPHQRASISF